MLTHNCQSSYIATLQERKTDKPTIGRFHAGSGDVLGAKTSD